MSGGMLAWVWGTQPYQSQCGSTYQAGGMEAGSSMCAGKSA